MTIINRLTVKNFRSIRELDLSLEPLTALVGPNGCGKSTILAALDHKSALEPTWRHERLPIEIHRMDAKGLGSLSTRFDNMGPNPLHRGHFTLSVQLLRLDLAQMRNDSVLERADALSESGHNLTNLVSTLSRAHQGALAAELVRRVSGIKDVDQVPTTAGKQRLRFHDRWSATEFTPHEVSDGTMLMLAFLALRFQKQRPDIITIEEPERGLHPYLLGELVNFLRDFTQGPDAIQVVLATHSAELLEHMKPQEVRFLSRAPEDGNVTVRTVDLKDADWPRYFREYSESLGSAWLSGGLGGTPQTN